MTGRTRRALSLALAATASITACGDDRAATSAASPTSTTPASASDDTDGGSPVEFSELDAIDPSGRVTGDAPASVVDDLVRRISEETGLAVDDISVDVAISKVWTDGSLGCAEPGFVYTQQEEAGYQIELSADGRAWSYRVRESGEVMTCDE